MARIRSVKPEVFKHDGLFDLERETGLPIRLAWIGLWTVCDREGRFVWRGRVLKPDVLPHDDVDFDAVLSALERGGFIIKYVVEGKTYGCIPTWDNHQTINQRESQSRIPPPPTMHVHAHVMHVHAHDEPSPCIATHVHARGEGKGKEGKGKEEEGKGKEPVVCSPVNSEQGTESVPGADSPSMLARQWCFVVTRRFGGRSKDDERDMTAEFANLAAMGVPCAAMLAEINKGPPQRDRGEHFWQFKARMLEEFGIGAKTKAGSANGKFNFFDELKKRAATQ